LSKAFNKSKAATFTVDPQDT